MSEYAESNPAVWAGFEPPAGHLLAWKVVRPDGRTRGDFRWPFQGVVRASAPDKTHTGPCPSAEGDGLCLALTWAGAASGGIPAITGLAVAYRPRDVLGEDGSKLRVRRCKVLGPIDLHREVREGKGSGADLYEANLSGADLHWADLSGADLYGAHLRGADLYEADLREADLSGADLRWADLRAADLREADLREANLRAADLHGADLHGAIGDSGEGYR